MTETQEGVVTVESFAEAAERANSTEEVATPPLSKKEAEKAKKEEQQAKKYWNTMISRREAYEMVTEALESQNDKFRLMLVQIQTLSQLLISKEITTEDDLNELSKPILAQIYGTDELVPEEDK